jgi:S-adenosylmethionine synthetase
MARWVAKHIVAAGFATDAEVQVAYAIGYPEPTSILVDTFGTGDVDDLAIAEAVREVFSFKPSAIVEQLGLRQPIFRRSTNYGHFTKSDLPWEQTPKVAALQDALKQTA